MAATPARRGQTAATCSGRRLNSSHQHFGQLRSLRPSLAAHFFAFIRPNDRIYFPFLAAKMDDSFVRRGNPGQPDTPTSSRHTGQPVDPRLFDPRLAGGQQQRFDPRIFGQQPVDPRLVSGRREEDFLSGQKVDPRLLAGQRGQRIEPFFAVQNRDSGPMPGQQRADKQRVPDPKMDIRAGSQKLDAFLAAQQKAADPPDPKMDPRFAGQMDPRLAAGRMDPRMMGAPFNSRQGMDSRLRPPPPYQPEKRQQPKKTRSVDPQKDLAGYIIAMASASAPVSPLGFV